MDCYQDWNGLTSNYSSSTFKVSLVRNDPWVDAVKVSSLDEYLVLLGII